VANWPSAVRSARLSGGDAICGMTCKAASICR
jgi:hypothetical protein